MAHRENNSIYTGVIPTIAVGKRPYRIAVTGHQQLGNAATIAFVAGAFSTLFEQLAHAHPHGLVALSGLAAGADSLFAEAALAHNIPLEACLACDELLDNFAPGFERTSFLALQARCQRVHQLPFVERSNEAYMALGRWLVDRCDVLVAVWNGLPAMALGGTGDVVAYARKQHRPLVHVHTLHHTIL